MKAKAGSTVDDYIRKLDPTRREIVTVLREIINAAAPRAEESIKWGSPCWTQNGYLCTVYTAGDHVNFGFSRGAELDDPDGLLEGTGKGMRHIKLRDAGAIRKTKFAALVKQAVKLNAAAGRE